jgi:uncharacterized protein YprB with RNaseH-like and TPR domain
MIEPSEQLARLRQRIAEVHERVAAKYPPKVQAPRREIALKEAGAHWVAEEWSRGEVVRNEFGEHFQTERLFAPHKRHGSVYVSALTELPADLLSPLGDLGIPAAPAERWAFLDTETTGLMGGPGIYAFLIGVGRITRRGFHIRQFFVREHLEERSVLAALASHLREFDLLVTYNGKTYDQPLLEARYQLADQKSPFARLAHVDLLHSSRRLWKFRLKSCRLRELEEQILGVCREGDLPGELIPYVYFEYLRSRAAQRVASIFHHNAIDILTLACLTAIVPAAFQASGTEELARLGIRRGEELAGIAHWMLTAGQAERAVALFRLAVEAGLPDGLLFRTLWDIALLEKKLGRKAAAVEALRELGSCKNYYQARALEELAKHYERQEKDVALALELTQAAIAAGGPLALARRKARLEKKLLKLRCGTKTTT